MAKPWIRTIRRLDGLIEHICSHEIGHPAYGSLLWREEQGVHGCDGCCSDPVWQLEDAREGLRMTTDLLRQAIRKHRELREQILILTDVKNKALAQLKKLALTADSEYPNSDDRHPDNDGTNALIKEMESIP